MMYEKTIFSLKKSVKFTIMKNILLFLNKLFNTSFMKKKWFLLFLFLITSFAYSNSPADRCPSVMSKISDTENTEEQVRIALEILEKDSSFETATAVLKTVRGMTSPFKAPIVSKMLERPVPNLTEISTSAIYVDSDGSNNQSVISKISEAENPEEQIRIALEILEESPYPDTQIAVLYSIRKIKKDNKSVSRIFFKILEQNPLPEVLKLVVYSASSNAGSNGVSFLLTLLENISDALQNKNSLLKNQSDELYKVISFIAAMVNDVVEDSEGFRILSKILEKKFPLSYEIIDNMAASAVNIGGKEGADFLIKMLEVNPSNKTVQNQIAGHIGYMPQHLNKAAGDIATAGHYRDYPPKEQDMKGNHEAVRVLLAIAEQKPPREVQQTMYESALEIGGEAEMHFLSTMLEKYPSSPLYETYKLRKKFLIKFRKMD